jgi:hypothetical protein
LFLALGILDQKLEDVIRGDAAQFLSFKMGIELVQEKIIILDRIFFPNSFSDNP